MGWVLLFVGVVVIGVVFILVAENKANDSKRQSLARVPGFTPAVLFAGGLASPGVAIDPLSSRFAFTHPGQPARVYGFSELVAVEVERNGSSLQKTNRGSQVAGAAVGAVLLGPVGLLLGGLTGSKRNEEKIRRLSLKVFTNDLEKPVTELIFFDNSGGAKAEDRAVRIASAQMDEWHGRFQTMLHMQPGATA